VEILGVGDQILSLGIYIIVYELKDHIIKLFIDKKVTFFKDFIEISLYFSMYITYLYTINTVCGWIFYT